MYTSRFSPIGEDRAIQFSEILDFQSLRIRCRRELRFPTFPIHWTKTLKLNAPVGEDILSRKFFVYMVFYRYAILLCV